MDDHGRDEIDINGTNRSEIYSEKKGSKNYMQRAKTVIPTGKERDVQEIFEYSLHPRKGSFSF
jgi:hypothetical protein